jgi:hypothetical protein
MNAFQQESLGAAYRFNLGAGIACYPHSDLDGPATMGAVFNSVETG